MTVNQKKKKKMMFLKYLILETPLYSVGILVLRTLSSLSPVFSGSNNNNLSVFLLKGYRENVVVLLYLFYSFKKENILDIFSIDLILFQVITL